MKVYRVIKYIVVICVMGIVWWVRYFCNLYKQVATTGIKRTFYFRNKYDWNLPIWRFYWKHNIEFNQSKFWTFVRNKLKK